MRKGRRHWLFTAAAAAWLPSLRAQPAVAQVDIRDFKFIPEILTVKAGTTVRWTNSERRTTHSVLFLAPLSFEGERMFPGESWQYRFDQPGSFAYSCGPHPQMSGRVEVTG